MANFRQIQLTVNIENGRFIDAADGEVIPKNKLPSLRYGETVVLCVSFVDSDGNAYVLNADDTFELALDNNADHTDDLMAYSADSQVDISGDWADIDRATGKISIRIDCLVTAFATKLANAWSIGAYLEIKRYIAGSSDPSTVLLNECYAKNVVLTTEGAPASADPEYYNATQVDALDAAKANKDFSSYAAKATVVDADSVLINDSADSGNPKYSLFSTIWTWAKAKADALYAAISHSHTASDVTDFDTEVSNNTTVAGKIDQDLTGYTVKTTPAGTELFFMRDGAVSKYMTLQNALSFLGNPVTLQGTWDASAGSFPGSGSAQAGYTYIVSVAGTVDGETAVGDRILAITNNASTSTFASNWFKLDYTDQVLSVNGKTGTVVIYKADISDFKHGIDSTSEHDGVSGATENNLIAFDANGLPKDSGKSAANFDDDFDINSLTAETTPAVSDNMAVDRSGTRKKATIAVLRQDINNDQTGTAYTLALTDAGKTVWMNNGSANEVTIPANSAVAFPVGTTIAIVQEGAGLTSITGDTGVTLNGVSAGSGDISLQYQSVLLIKRDTDTWIALGAIGEVA